MNNNQEGNKMENEFTRCCKKCKAKSLRPGIIGTPYCAKFGDCDCHFPSPNTNTEECGVMIHTRGFEAMGEPIYCANKKPCPMHTKNRRNSVDMQPSTQKLDTNTTMDWEKEFDERFHSGLYVRYVTQTTHDKLYYEDCSETAKDFILSLITEERKRATEEVLQKLYKIFQYNQIVREKIKDFAKSKGISLSE